MIKYWRVLRLFWTTALAAELEYRLNFLIATLSSSANLVGNLFGLFIFYRTGYTFGGWDWQEAAIVLGVFTFLQGVSGVFLIPNLNKIVQQVEQGTLDFVLLKPIDSQFWLSTRTLSPWGIPDLFFGAIVILHAGGQLGLTAGDYLPGALAMTCGIVILYNLWFMLGATSIWFVKIYNVTEVLRGFLEAGRYPIVAYPVIYRFLFTFVVPVAFLTTVPAEILLGRVGGARALGTALLAVVLSLFSRLFWRFALRFYTSASS